MIRLKRVYETPHRTDGTRILVERLWPRGLSKEKAKVDAWLRDVAPSTELRRWFNHDPDRWKSFVDKYFEELSSRDEAVATLREHIAAGPVTFVFAAREERFNNAVALKEYMERDD